MAPIHSRMTPQEWGLLIVLSMIWGSSFFFQGVAIKELPPLTIVWFRVFLAAITMIVIVKLIGQRNPLNKRTLGPFLGLGLVGMTIPFTLLIWAQIYIPSSLASILNALTPMTTMLVAHVFTTDEKMTRRKWLGMFTAFAGVTLMIGPSALLTMGTAVLAQLACVGACLCYGFAGTFGRRFQVFELTPIELATGQCIMASVALLPVMLWVDQPWTLPAPSVGASASVIGLAVLSTAIAYMFFFRILATAGATNLTLVTFLVPVTAITLGILFLDEHLTPTHLWGAGGIALGLAIIDGRLISFIIHMLVKNNT